jgi:NADH:ubiquinone oxidoreductase subunit 4 (subunit M)
MNPSLSLALAVAVVATLVLGIYPRALFDFAESSARTLGVTGVAAAVR